MGLAINTFCPITLNHRSMQRKTAANEQDKVHKLLFSIINWHYNSSRWAAGRVKINSVPTPSVLMTLIFSSCA